MTNHLRDHEFIPYADGRLAEAERRRLETHLGACANCRERLEELRGVLGVLNEWKAAEPSPAFDARLRARLAEEPETTASFDWLRPAYGGALAVAVLVLAAALLDRWAPIGEAPTPPVAQVQPTPTVPPARPQTTAPAQPKTPTVTTDANDTLAVLENPAVLDNFEMIEQFDALFEAQQKEAKKL
jgi:anti-sigma factor RsiW